MQLPVKVAASLLLSPSDLEPISCYIPYYSNYTHKMNLRGTLNV